MKELNQLIDQASNWHTDSPVAEVHRVLQICNACRYCEGFCSVFQAMTRRIDFSTTDIHYFANLCHNCGACLHACQYAPPHQFQVNIPKAMAEVRLETYQSYAFPKTMGYLYTKFQVPTVLALMSILTIVFWYLSNAVSASGDPNSGFYQIFSHNVLVFIFGIPFVVLGSALLVSVTKFWCDIRVARVTPFSLWDGLKSIFFLKNLSGGHQEGCNDRDDQFSLWRRRFHHFTFYGFLLCFMATSVATIYHYVFSYEAPYPLISAPVILGTLGGIGLIIGPLGLWYLNVVRHPLHGDLNQKPIDRGFIVTLVLISATGLMLMLLRDTSNMKILFCAHLATVMTFFVLIPYGKFSHGIYRSLALIRNAVEVHAGIKSNVSSD